MATPAKISANRNSFFMLASFASILASTQPLLPARAVGAGQILIRIGNIGYTHACRVIFQLFVAGAKGDDSENHDFVEDSAVFEGAGGFGFAFSSVRPIHFVALVFDTRQFWFGFRRGVSE